MPGEHLSIGESTDDKADPYSDPEVLTAAALTRFAWGQTGEEYRAAYSELIRQRYGLDEQGAKEVLATINSTHIPSIENWVGDEQ